MAPGTLACSRTALVLLTLIALIVLALPSPAAAAQRPVDIEVRLEALLNAERAKHGLPALRTDVRLVATARHWAQQMAAADQLSHHPDLGSAVPRGATLWGENIGTSTAADAAEAIHKSLMSSPTHRALLIGDRFTDLGVGVVVAGGRTWATQHLTAGAPARVSAAVGPTAALAVDLFGGGRAKHAVVVRDDVFPDSLAAGPLAGDAGPILFTPPGPVAHPKVLAALERALPRGATVWIVGGSAAVSKGVEGELSAAGWKVRRVAGPDRVATAVAVADAVVARDGRPTTVLLATAANWPDAASGGAYGAVSGSPVLLAYPSDLPDPTARALANLKPRQIVALGGDAALSDQVVRSAGADRLAGATRQGTAAAVAEELWGKTKAAQASAWIVTPANGEAWAWALGAAPLAARRGAPVLIAGDPLSVDLRSYLKSLGYGGGTAAILHVHGPVPGSAVRELESLLR